MKRTALIIGAIFTLLTTNTSIKGQQAYNITAPHDPATVKMAEEKRGEVIKFEITDSPTYPGTTREVWVYIPKQYQDTAPACLLVCMDGILYDATTIMDNLIATGEMPITIGVFVNPGVVYDENGEVVRYNRCKEFDSTDDNFVSFLEQEVLPRVEGMQTKNGQTIRLSSDANDRAITGASSGGIAAFTAAWNRPDMFSRVYTTVGTFVAMRGGHEYPAIVRKTEPKPLRIYMQDGWYDVWNPIFGEWFEYNLLMESAFNFAGYEAFHVWNRGNHSIKYGTLAFPDAMRWLWKGYPARVQKGWSNNGMLQSILLPDCDWQIIPTNGSITGDIYPSHNGQATYTSGSKVHTIDPITRDVVNTIHLKTGEEWMGDGLILRGSNLYHHGKKVAEGLYDCQGVQALADNKYVVLCSEKSRPNSNVYILTQGERALAISPDYRLCVSGQAQTHHLLSTIMNQQGQMLYTEPFYYLQDLSNGTEYTPGNMAFDTEGNLYVATKLGVQVVDHNGRTRAILSLPAGEVQSLAFSGNYLYVVCSDHIYVRKMKATGHCPLDGKINYKSQGQG
jgi:enterochelin esterase-like enzyme